MIEPAISASVMCADQLNIGRAVSELERAGIDYLHLDVMDGHYVPNITLGIDLCNSIKAITHIPVDIHLLVNNPGELIGSFAFERGDIVSVHYDCGSDLGEIAKLVHGRGATFGVVLNLGDDIDETSPTLHYADIVSLMMIKPGFAGQCMAEGAIDRIKVARDRLDQLGRLSTLIEVDGNVNVDNVPIMRKNGGDIFVAGSSSIFKQGVSIVSGVEALRKAIG